MIANPTISVTSNGMFFSYVSTLRGLEFVTRKITDVVDV